MKPIPVPLQPSAFDSGPIIAKAVSHFVDDIAAVSARLIYLTARDTARGLPNKTYERGALAGDVPLPRAYLALDYLWQSGLVQREGVPGQGTFYSLRRD